MLETKAKRGRPATGKKQKTTRQRSLEREAEALEKIVWKGLTKLDALQDEIERLEGQR